MLCCWRWAPLWPETCRTLLEYKKAVGGSYDVLWSHVRPAVCITFLRQPLHHF